MWGMSSVYAGICRGAGFWVWGNLGYSIETSEGTGKGKHKIDTEAVPCTKDNSSLEGVMTSYTATWEKMKSRRFERRGFLE